jgi:hypothetical protein
LKAIALDEGSQDTIETSEAPQPQAKNGASPDERGHAARVSAPRDGSKLALVIEHLQRVDGVLKRARRALPTNSYLHWWRTWQGKRATPMTM